MNIHFVGIGGIGVSGLAQFCLSRGDQVTGSEMQETEILPLLRSLGIEVSIPQKAANVPQDCELLVYSEAVPDDNPERQFAADRGIPQKSYFQYLGEVSRDYRVIAVAGTHGKTTTTGMIAAGFQTAGFDGTVLVGSTLREFEGSNFHAGNNQWLLVEACEYRENFQFLKPEIVVLTNVEWDHPDYYETEEQYLEAFRNFVQDAKTVICHQDDEVVWDLLEDFKGERRAIPRQSPNSWEFLLSVFGDMNHRNATLALGLADKLELNLEYFKKGLGQFSGTGRRQEFLGEWKGIKVFDDYGHHPTEIRSTLEAFRDKFPEKKVALVYEPHQFSRTREFFADFVEALRLADHLALHPIYGTRDTAEDRAAVSIDSLLEHLENARKVEHTDHIRDFASALDEGDVLLFMGAGRIGDVARNFLA